MGEARALVKNLIHQVAPNLELEAANRFESLRDVGGFDSLDFVNLMAVAAEVTGVSVPPRDYPLVITIDGFATYLLTHAGRAHASARQPRP
jgi:acyl carrier protein